MFASLMLLVTYKLYTSNEYNYGSIFVNIRFISSLLTYKLPIDSMRIFASLGCSKQTKFDRILCTLLFCSPMPSIRMRVMTLQRCCRSVCKSLKNSFN